jgi:hypothetical protein
MRTNIRGKELHYFNIRAPDCLWVCRRCAKAVVPLGLPIIRPRVLSSLELRSQQSVSPPPGISFKAQILKIHAGAEEGRGKDRSSKVNLPVHSAFQCHNGRRIKFFPATNVGIEMGTASRWL